MALPIPAGKGGTVVAASRATYEEARGPWEKGIWAGKCGTCYPTREADPLADFFLGRFWAGRGTASTPSHVADDADQESEDGEELPFRPSKLQPQAIRVLCHVEHYRDRLRHPGR